MSDYVTLLVGILIGQWSAVAAYFAGRRYADWRFGRSIKAWGEKFESMAHWQ